MTEHTVRLRKETGGATIAGITWASDGDVQDVPYGLALELLAIDDADFTVPDDEVDPLPDRPKRSGGRRKAVTEPAPAPAAAVTEPAPPAGPDTAAQEDTAPAE